MGRPGRLAVIAVAVAVVSLAAALWALLDKPAAPAPAAATSQQIADAKARVAMYGGGTYLIGRLDPATAAPLADAVHSFANDLQDISIAALDGVGNDDPAQMARLRDGEAASERIADLCK